jgi:hypothetical protein
MSTQTTERAAQHTALAKLQALMKAENMSYYIVPSEDAHQSEYIAPQDMRRAFVSGFTGSAGLALVSNVPGEKHGLWTDGRYYLQAEHELDQHWELHKVTDPPVAAYLTTVRYSPERIQYLIPLLSSFMPSAASS